MSWKPILEGELASLALESVQAILADLQANASPSDQPSLAGGTAGLAVLHGYLAQGEDRSAHAIAAHRLLQASLAAVTARPTVASLYSGLAGIGWALAHLRRRSPNLNGEDDLAQIDEVLLHLVEPSPWAGPYDLVEGLVGFGVYALERLPRPSAVAMLACVVNRLAQTAEQQDNGVTWRTDPSWLPADQRAEHSHASYDLGLAHGVPGVIAFLGQACAANVAAPTARPLLESAVRWLLAQQGPQGFAYCVAPRSQGELGNEELGSRLAWCYGDPGIAAALHCVARCLGERTWETQALAIARRAAKCEPDQAGVMDAGLCHGACGLGHLFNRIYQSSRDEALADAARFWFKEVLRMRRPGRGVGGYEAWEPDRGWIADPSFLTGAAGIALALLAATTSKEPEWDRALLVSSFPS
jgi:lantibiotic modifying enzyme